jgi:hypothetical protein
MKLNLFPSDGTVSNTELPYGNLREKVKGKNEITKSDGPLFFGTESGAENPSL